MLTNSKFEYKTLNQKEHSEHYQSWSFTNSFESLIAVHPMLEQAAERHHNLEPELVKRRASRGPHT